MEIFAHNDSNPYLRADSLEELCRFADTAFVRCAFVTILGRQPDPAGEDFYLARLRAGVAKLTIIGELRVSREGRQHDPGIAGLDRVIRRHRRNRWPVVGRLLRWFNGGEGDSAVEMRLRTLQNMIETEWQLAANRAGTLHHRQVMISQELAAIADQLRQVLAGQSSSPGRIVHAEGGGEVEWKRALDTVLHG